MQDMYCRQCEQTFRGDNCHTVGVCGKTAEVARLQDALVYTLEGEAAYAWAAWQVGVRDPARDNRFLEHLFATLTNVNFDPASLRAMIAASHATRRSLAATVEASGEASAFLAAQGYPAAVLNFSPETDAAALDRQATQLSIPLTLGSSADLRSVKELVLYGIKGTAAYAHHASRFGAGDESIVAFLYRATAAIARNDIGLDELLALAMTCGEANYKAMDVLDGAHTARFGDPTPASVKLGVARGPAIIVSGHDLLDLEEILVQSAGKGVSVYTHGELLPAHGYPALRAHPHLRGHFGTAWQNQQKEFWSLPAAIAMTTNCLQEPSITYSDRLYTTNAVAWTGIAHVADGASGRKDWSAVIAKAIELGGFPEDDFEKEITVGFAHKTVLGVAPQVIDAVKKGDIRRFFLIGGCDGARSGRNYYTRFAESVPDDCVILTLGCGKNRFNKLDLGTVAGFPKVLDMGQCNDAYSAIVVAKALAGAFHCGVNDLPLSLIVSWYEQKAVAVLLTLLWLGIRNIRLGPTLPAFLTPNVAKVLVEKFQIHPITTVESDLRACLG